DVPAWWLPNRSCARWKRMRQAEQFDTLVRGGVQGAKLAWHVAGLTRQTDRRHWGLPSRLCSSLTRRALREDGTRCWRCDMQRSWAAELGCGVGLRGLTTDG